MWALALHGGAGVIHKTIDRARKIEYEHELARALDIGCDILRSGGRAVLAVEAVVRFLEDCPLFNAGKGSVFTHDGLIELEASIMDGETMAIGAVTGLMTVKNPICLARKVMEKRTFLETTFLACEAAEKFADGLPEIARCPQEYFFVQRRFDDLRAQLGVDSKAADEDRAGPSQGKPFRTFEGQPRVNVTDPAIVGFADLQSLADRLSVLQAEQREHDEQRGPGEHRQAEERQTANAATYTWPMAELVDKSSQACQQGTDATTSTAAFFSADKGFQVVASGKDASTSTAVSFSADKASQVVTSGNSKDASTSTAAAITGPETGTVGCVALDVSGNLAAGTSTGGRTNKMSGRIGDTPVIGAGNYAKNATCACSGTGRGEEFQRHVVAHTISCAMEYGHMSLANAAEHVVFKVLKPGDGGIVAVDRLGNIAMPFNSVGMFRAAADGHGLRKVAIWD